MASLDTELDSLLAEKDYFEKNPSAGTLPIGPDDPLRIAVKFMGEALARHSQARAPFRINRWVIYSMLVPMIAATTLLAIFLFATFLALFVTLAIAVMLRMWWLRRKLCLAASANDVHRGSSINQGDPQHRNGNGQNTNPIHRPK